MRKNLVNSLEKRMSSENVAASMQNASRNYEQTLQLTEIKYEDIDDQKNKIVEKRGKNSKAPKKS